MNTPNHPKATAIAFGISLNALLIHNAGADPRHSNPPAPQPTQQASDPQPFFSFFSEPPQTHPMIPAPPLHPQHKSAAKPRKATKTKHPKPRRKSLVKHHLKHHALSPLRQAPALLIPNPDTGKPLYNGPYAGVIGGAQWLHHPKPVHRAALHPVPLYSRHASLQPTGVIWGLSGINYQFNSLITGIEADLGYANLASPYGTLFPFREFEEGSLRTRFGIDFQHVLAFGSTDLTLGVFNKAGPRSSTSTLRAGWTTSGGLELPIAPNVTWRTEYFYTFYPNSGI